MPQHKIEAFYKYNFIGFNTLASQNLYFVLLPYRRFLQIIATWNFHFIR